MVICQSYADTEQAAAAATVSLMNVNVDMW